MEQSPCCAVQVNPSAQAAVCRHTSHRGTWIQFSVLKISILQAVRIDCTDTVFLWFSTQSAAQFRFLWFTPTHMFIVALTLTITSTSFSISKWVTEPAALLFEEKYFLDLLSHKCPVHRKHRGTDSSMLYAGLLKIHHLSLSYNLNSRKILCSLLQALQHFFSNASKAQYLHQWKAGL